MGNADQGGGGAEPRQAKGRGLRKEWRARIKEAKARAGAGDATAARDAMREVAKLAARTRNQGLLRRTANTLDAMSDANGAATIRAYAKRLVTPPKGPEWGGEYVDGLLVIDERGEHVGALIRWARLIGLAAERAKQCVVLAQPRLLDLFARTFPGVEVQPADENSPLYSEAKAIAGYRSLLTHLAPNDKAVRASFRPLLPDTVMVRELRSSYAKSGKPVIGISWASTNTMKQLPSLAEWAEFLAAMNATYVSLQYGDVEADARALSGGGTSQLIVDASVDSLVDIDRYAAQVAAMDTVVTISNTCAHMAGALGVPTFCILDDRLQLEWQPKEGEQVPWYPAMAMIRQKNRAWPEVFGEVSERLGVRV